MFNEAQITDDGNQIAIRDPATGKWSFYIKQEALLELMMQFSNPEIARCIKKYIEQQSKTLQ